MSVFTSAGKFIEAIDAALELSKVIEACPVLLAEELVAATLTAWQATRIAPIAPAIGNLRTKALLALSELLEHCVSRSIIAAISSLLFQIRGESWWR